MLQPSLRKISVTMKSYYVKFTYVRIFLLEDHERSEVFFPPLVMKQVYEPVMNEAQ